MGGHTADSSDDNYVKTIGSLGRLSERELPTHALTPGLVALRFQGGSVDRELREESRRHLPPTCTRPSNTSRHLPRTVRQSPSVRRLQPSTTVKTLEYLVMRCSSPPLRAQRP